MADRDARLGAIASRHHGVFSGTQAIAAGFPRTTIQGRVRSGAWNRLIGDTYAPTGAPVGWEQRTTAAWLAARSPAAVAGMSAASIWDLGLPPADTPNIVVPSSRRPRLSGVQLVRTGRWERTDIVWREPLLVTSVPRTLLDLAPILGDEVLEEVLDRAHRHGLNLDRFARYLQLPQHLRLARIGVLKALVARRDPGRPIESELETRLWRVLREANLPVPVPQYEIKTRSGTRRLDFAYPQQMVALEVDGYRAHHGRRPYDADRARANDIREAGWDLRHITSPMLDSPFETVLTVATALGLRPTRWRRVS